MREYGSAYGSAYGREGGVAPEGGRGGGSTCAGKATLARGREFVCVFVCVCVCVCVCVHTHTHKHVPARAERHSRADQPPGNSYLSSGFVFLVFRGYESGPLMA